MRLILKQIKRTLSGSPKCEFVGMLRKLNDNPIVIELEPAERYDHNRFCSPWKSDLSYKRRAVHFWRGFCPGTNQYNPNLSMGLFLVITNIEVAQSFEYVGKRKHINPENKNWGVASCELIGNSRSKALAKAWQLAAELKSAGICDYVLEVKPRAF